MNRRLLNVMSAALVLVFWSAIVAFYAGGTQAQQPRQQTPQAEPMTAESFVQQLAKSNRTEIELARMAMQRSQSGDVKDYADQLIRDHTEILEDLRDYASDNGISLEATAERNEPLSERTPQQPDDTQPEELARADETDPAVQLSSKSGAEFDMAYVRMMVENHQKGVSLFEQQKEADLGDDDLQDFIDDHLPTLRDHLAEAMDIQRELQEDPR